MVTKIPLIIVGKPGTDISLSAQLILNSMRRKYSKPKNGKKEFLYKISPDKSDIFKVLSLLLLKISKNYLKKWKINIKIIKLLKKMII